ncbi:MAG TPA: HNH endonuclease [Bellilinea sp.]|jgi:5-methylcytosine-specific restriction endonuclease McrA|nr:HNH endonuclease [Bellilinea sp.]
MLDNVLVLNANFQPINICTVRRAVGLIITDKAALVVNGRGYIHTINQVVPRPSIIRLQHMVNRPRLRVKLNRREIFRRDNFTCQYCGKQGGNLTIDHVYPRHLGGQHLWNNVVTACAACNHRKGGRTLKESGMQLARLPREPQASAEYVFGRHLSDYDDWLPFLQGW